MFHNQDIICISSVDWDFIWQGNQEVMSTLAKHDNRVLFIENTGIRSPSFRDIPRVWKRLLNRIQSTKGFKEVQKNVYIYYPVILPFPYYKWARWINRILMFRTLHRWLRLMRFDRAIVWTFLPTQIALDIFDEFQGKLLVYYCAGDFDQLVKNGQRVKKVEEKLLKRCDLVFTIGQDFKKEWKHLNSNILIYPYGVNLDTFEQVDPQRLKTPPPEMASIPKPIIGYVGGIHRHIDFDLVETIAQRFSKASLVFVGPIQTDVSHLLTFKNIIFTGQKAYVELPYYISHFDVCIIPYVKSDYTQTVNPSKMHGYHAVGKPVISTPLPEVVSFDQKKFMYIAETPDDFCQKIEVALHEKDPQKVKARVESAKEHSWTNRVEQMTQDVENALKQKLKRSPEKWYESFLASYRLTYFRLLKLSLCFILLWGIIFYSPLVWYCAEPLKKSSKLEKANAIVVLGGGVGESGVSGQGYEERISHAVDLYKKGYAKTLILSSGMRGVFSEAYVMKALAVSSGIPESAILIDEQASNTYKNVTYVDRIANEYQLRNLIFVSSPYHMLRLSLVIEKNMPEKKVQYAPILRSSFYSHPEGRGWKYIFLRKVNRDQINGILHEYLAIVNYWWKEYL